ncbi:MAG: glycosyltransferase family 2 protein [Propionibacteriaceae bacterium]|nr:glycosyltransferase family 2 protein [Propionibacteriaceae bacterium]
MTARVSIVMRTKDRPVLLARALADVAAQTFTAWELIVVNDVGAPAPVDAAVAALEASVRERVRVLHRTESVGMESASNAGLAVASGEYACIHDDDDTWAPEFLERTVAHLDAHPDDVGVVVRTQIVRERVDGDRITETGRDEFWPELPAISLSDLLRTNRFVPIQLLYRRAVHDTIGPFNEGLRVVGDWDFHLRLLRRHTVGLIDETLAFWHHREAADGALANSVAALDEHARADLLLRDEQLKDAVAERGLGELLYLTRYLQGQFDHLHQRLNHIEHRLDEIEAGVRSSAEDAARRQGGPLGRLRRP